MSRGMRNTFQFIGNVATELDIREKVTHFTIAVDRYGKYKSKKEEGDGQETGGTKKKKDADFIRLTAFGPIKGFLDQPGRLPKGERIIVSGHIRQDEPYEKDGRMVYGQSYIIDEFEYGSGKMPTVAVTNEEGEKEPDFEPTYEVTPADETAYEEAAAGGPAFE